MSGAITLWASDSICQRLPASCSMWIPSISGTLLPCIMKQRANWAPTNDLDLESDQGRFRTSACLIRYSSTVKRASLTWFPLTKQTANLASFIPPRHAQCFAKCSSVLLFAPSRVRSPIEPNLPNARSIIRTRLSTVIHVHRLTSAVVIYPYSRALHCCKLAPHSNDIQLPMSHHHLTPFTRLGKSKDPLLL